MLEWWLADPPDRWHPVAWLGQLAGYAERLYYADSRWRGVWLYGLIIAPCAALLWSAHELMGWPADVLMLWLSTGWHSLFRHVRKVLDADQPADARVAVSHIVSRDTQQMNMQDARRAALESLAENASDAVLAPLFWFTLFGAPAAACYRMVNTLDAMWGYRNSRYRNFGWCAARVDDIANYLPARLTAISLFLCGQRCCWHQLASQAATHASPNAGWPEAALAHAAGIRLGGPVWRDGKLDERPPYGPMQARKLNQQATQDAMRCVHRSLALAILALLLLL